MAEQRYSTKKEKKVDGIYSKCLNDLFSYTRDRIINRIDYSKHIPQDLTLMTEQLWQEAKPQLITALDEEFNKLLQEFETLERFKELEGLRSEHSKDGPAWKYSGIPSEDYSTFSNITAQTFLPQYEALYSEAHEVTDRLRESYKEKKSKLTTLEEDIQTHLSILESSVKSLPSHQN